MANQLLVNMRVRKQRVAEGSGKMAPNLFGVLPL